MDVYWLEQVDGDVPPNDDWLSASEAAFLARLRFAKRRADWRLGRWTAKRAVSEYLSLQRPPVTVEIRAAPSGAPEVYLDSQAAKVTISLSHRAGRAVCAVAHCGAALGCDLELVEPRSSAFAADYFTAGEQSLVARAAPVCRAALLALLWSGKGKRAQGTRRRPPARHKVCDRQPHGCRGRVGPGRVASLARRLRKRADLRRLVAAYRRYGADDGRRARAGAADRIVS